MQPDPAPPHVSLGDLLQLMGFVEAGVVVVTDPTGTQNWDIVLAVKLFERNRPDLAASVQYLIGESMASRGDNGKVRLTPMGKGYLYRNWPSFHPEDVRGENP